MELLMMHSVMTLQVMVNNILIWWFSKRLNLSEGLVTAGSDHNVVTKIVGWRSTDVSGTEVALWWQSYAEWCHRLIIDVAYHTVRSIPIVLFCHSHWYSVRFFDCCDVDVNKACWNVELIMMHSCILVSNLLVVICSRWAWLNVYTWSSYSLKVVLLCFIVDQRPTDIPVYI